MDKCLFISKSALLDNVLHYASTTNKDIIAVIKNNAYGHGVKEVLSILEEAEIKMYAVSNIYEAVEARKYTKRDILIMDKIEDYTSIDNGMVITVISKKHLLELIRLDLPLRIHLKVNVGMRRKGIESNEIQECIRLINKSNLLLEGIYTHFSTYKNKQLKKEFEIYKITINKIDISGLMLHASSSISSLVLRENVTNAIRIGVGMYGLKKVVKEMAPLRITTELKCEIKNSYKIKNGDTFSYGNIYHGKSGYIFMANIGYGDGLFYHKKMKGIIEGDFIKEIGTRNMDNTYFFSKNYFLEGSIIEIYGNNVKMDYISKKNRIAVCRLLALLNANIKKEIIE